MSLDRSSTQILTGGSFRRLRLRQARGSGVLLGLAVMGATLSLVVGILPVATVLVIRGQAAGAADAAALAAADAASGLTAGSPCPVAESVAVANGAVLVGCRVDGGTATVAIERVFGAVVVPARATAGPPSAAGR